MCIQESDCVLLTGATSVLHCILGANILCFYFLWRWGHQHFFGGKNNCSVSEVVCVGMALPYSFEDKKKRKKKKLCEQRRSLGYLWNEEAGVNESHTHRRGEKINHRQKKKTSPTRTSNITSSFRDILTGDKSEIEKPRVGIRKESVVERRSLSLSPGGHSFVPLNTEGLLVGG